MGLEAEGLAVLPSIGAASDEALWTVWIETNMSLPGLSPDWWANAPALLLPAALKEAEECRRAGFPVRVLPEGDMPTPDALPWDSA